MPTFGNTNSPAGYYPPGADRGILSKFTAPANGTLVSVTFWLDNSGSIDAKGLVYADNGSGLPGAVLAVGSVVTGSNGQFTSGGMSLVITAGTPYWLGAVEDNTTSGIGYSSGGTYLSQDSSVTYATPTTWGENANASGFDVAVFATYNLPAPSGIAIWLVKS